MKRLTLPLEKGVTSAVQAPVKKGVFIGDTSMTVYAARESDACQSLLDMLKVR